MGKLGDRRAAAPLLALFKQLLPIRKDLERLSRKVISSLGELKVTEAFQPLLEVVVYEDISRHTREIAIGALEAIDHPQKVDLLIRISHSDHLQGDEARHVVRLLGITKQPDVIERILELLIEYEEIRLDDVEVALQNFGKRVIPKLLQLIKHPNAEIREYAIWSLDQIGDVSVWQQVMLRLQDADEDEGVRDAALDFIAHHADGRMVQQLTERLWSDYYDKAFEILEKLGLQALEGLIAALQHEDIAIQDDAVGALLKIGDARAVLPLLQRFEHINYTDEKDRKIADIMAQDFAELCRKDSAAQDVVINCFQQTTNHSLQAGCLHTLVYIATDKDDAPASIHALFSENLYHDIEHIRERAALGIAAIGENIDMAALQRHLYKMLNDDPSPYVRAAAARALGKYQPAAEHLLSHLTATSNDETVRAGLIAALHDLRHRPATPAIIACLQDPSVMVRREAVFALRDLNSDASRKAIVQALYDDDEVIRRIVLRTIEQRKISSAVEPLIDILSSADAQDVTEFASTLAELGDKRAGLPLARMALQELRNPKSSSRRKASRRRIDLRKGLRSLRDLSRQVKLDVEVAEILVMILREGGDEQYTRFLADTLQAIGKRCVPLLIEALPSLNSKQQRLLIGVLGGIGDSSAVPALLPFLQHTEVYTRRKAVSALCSIGDLQALQPVIDMIQHEEYKQETYDQVDTELWHTFVGFGGDAIPMLARAIPTCIPQVKRIILHSLRQLNDSRAFDVYITCLDDVDRHVRLYSVWGLQALRDQRAVPHLLSKFMDAEQQVREASYEAVASLGSSVTPLLLEMLGHDKRLMRQGAVHALAQMGNVVLKDLMDAQQSADPRVRRHAQITQSLVQMSI